MSLQKADIEKTAHLARLHLEEAQIPAICDSLNSILGLVEKMQQVDTRGVKELANPHDAKQRLREDFVSSVNQRETLMANAPEAANGLFLVPKVID